MKLNRTFPTFLLLTAVVLTSCQNKVDLIVHNGSINTMSQSKPVASAFVVDDGKFIDVGDEALLKKYEATRVIDLKGLPVYPGFIDSHCHFLGLGLSLQQVDLVGTASFKEVLDRVSRFASKKNLKAITGRGWDQNDWKSKKLPNKEALLGKGSYALLVQRGALDAVAYYKEVKGDKRALMQSYELEWLKEKFKSIS